MKKFIKAAAIFASSLKYQHVIIGSVAMRVDKIEAVEPNDLDIVIDVRDFNRLFPDVTEHQVSKSGKLSSYLAIIEIGGVQIEVMSDICTTTSKSRKSVPVSFGFLRNYERSDGRVLSFAKPSGMIEFYRLLGRPKDLEKIKLIRESMNPKYFQKHISK